MSASSNPWSRGRRAAVGMVLALLVAAVICVSWWVCSAKRDGAAQEAGDRTGEARERDHEGAPGSGRSASNRQEVDAARLEALAAAVRRATSDGAFRARQELLSTGPHPAFIAAMDRDGQRYSQQEMKRIEELYRRGNAEVDTAEGRASLARLVKDHPESNRGGCAASNLGAYYLNNGDLEEATSYYQGIIDLSSNAVFESGEKVLPKALYNLGVVFEKQGEDEAAAALWKKLADEFTDDLDVAGTTYGELAGAKL